MAPKQKKPQSPHPAMKSEGCLVPEMQSSSIRRHKKPEYGEQRPKGGCSRDGNSSQETLAIAPAQAIGDGIETAAAHRLSNGQQRSI
jgi:hypothetical protein